MRDVVISLFDLTGAAVQPWVDAGYTAYIVDIQHPTAYDSNGMTREGGVIRVHHDLSKPWLVPADILSRVAFVFAWPPCDHLAVSGARWFKGKGLGLLAKSIELFDTAATMCQWIGAPYMIENPVSNISSHWRKPDHYFHPHWFTRLCPEDNYTKKTCLWVGNGFVMPEQWRDESLGDPDDRIHKAAPGPERANFRSATPAGFSKAVFLANGLIREAA